MINTPKPAPFNDTNAAPPSYTALPAPLSEPLSLSAPQPPPSTSNTNFRSTSTGTSITPLPIDASMNSGLEQSQIKENSRPTVEEKPVSVLVHVGQAFLVLLTSPFMFLYGIFKLLGTLFKAIGVFFSMMGDWAYALAYKPGKAPSRVASNDVQLV